MTARAVATQHVQVDVADLVEKAARGDKDAFGRLVDIYKDRIYNYVARMLGDPIEAQDVTQEAFVRAYEALPSFRGASSFQTWIYRIASNLAIDSARGRKRRQDNVVSLSEPIDAEQGELPRELPDEGKGPDDEVLSNELQQIVQQAIAQLPPKLQTVLILYDLEGMSYQEIAQILGCPLGTVKSRLFNARHQLKRILQGRLEQENLPATWLEC